MHRRFFLFKIFKISFRDFILLVFFFFAVTNRFFFLLILDGKFESDLVFLIFVTLLQNFKAEVFAVLRLTFVSCELHEELGVLELVGVAGPIRVVERFILFVEESFHYCPVFFFFFVMSDVDI